MPPIQITTSEEIMMEYFGTDDLGVALMKMENREAERRLEFSDAELDTSLFPYEASGPLDTPLPTLAEIAAARAAVPVTLRDTVVNTGAVQTVRVGPYMVKYGPAVEILQEAENMIYLGKNTDVRVPKVYAAFASQDLDQFAYQRPKQGDEESGQSRCTSDKYTYYYLITEYINGGTLSDAEGKMDWPTKKKSRQLLAEQMRRLRAVPPPDPNLFSRIGGRPLPRMFKGFWCPPAPSYDDYGPYDYESLVDRLVHTATVIACLNSIDDTERLLLHYLRIAMLDNVGLHDRQPVLSHLDLGLGNITVKGLVLDDDGKIIDIEEVVIIDWEYLCWMPAWLELSQICEPCIASRVGDPWAGYAEELITALGGTSLPTAVFLAFCMGRFIFNLV